MNDRAHLAILGYFAFTTATAITVLAVGAIVNVQRVGNEIAQIRAEIKTIHTQLADLKSARQQVVLDALPDILAPVEVRIPR